MIHYGNIGTPYKYPYKFGLDSHGYLCNIQYSSREILSMSTIDIYRMNIRRSLETFNKVL